MAGGTNNALVDDKNVVRQRQQTKLQGFREFLYNKKEGKVLGRTGKSWRKFSRNAMAFSLNKHFFDSFPTLNRNFSIFQLK